MNEVLLDQGGQWAGQVGTVQLLSLPLGREVGFSPTPLSPSPHRQRGASLAETPSPHKCPPKQNVWVSFLPKPWRKGPHPFCALKATPLQFGSLIQGTCEVRPTHLGVGRYLPGKLEQVRPVGHLRPRREVPAWCSPTCCSVWGCCGCPVASWVCRFAASTG